MTFATNNMKQLSTETPKEYRERQKRECGTAKGRIVRTLWPSGSRGTYVRARDGELFFGESR